MNPQLDALHQYPFGQLVQSGASCKLLDIYAAAPYAAPAFGAGHQADGLIGLVGQSRSALATNLVTKWFHHGEEPYRVEDPYSGVKAGGHDNDPLL